MEGVIFILIRFLFFYLFIFGIFSEPIFFQFKNEKQKKWEECFFKLKETEPKNNPEKNFKEIDLIANQNSIKTILQIECAKKISDKNEIKTMIENSFSDLQSELEIFNRFIYSYEKTSLSPMDRKKSSEFVKAKYDLNSLVLNRVLEISEKENLNEYKQELKSIYSSVLVLHRDYFQSISKELRQEIFTKLKITH